MHYFIPVSQKSQMNNKEIYDIKESHEVFHISKFSKNERLYPWEEKKYIKANKSTNKSNKKSKAYQKRSKSTFTPYFKNLSNAQQYNIYPVQKPIFPTPVQFIFIGDEEFQNLQNDLFREDSKYLFPPNYVRYILTKFFYKWKNQIVFLPKEVKLRRSKPKKAYHNSNVSISLRENEEHPHKIKWMNDDYEVSPISIEYYSQKKLKPTKASNRLFNASLTQSQIGDFQNDKIWKKIIYHY